MRDLITCGDGTNRLASWRVTCHFYRRGFGKGGMELVVRGHPNTYLHNNTYKAGIGKQDNDGRHGDTRPPLLVGLPDANYQVGRTNDSG